MLRRTGLILLLSNFFMLLESHAQVIELKWKNPIPAGIYKGEEVQRLYFSGASFRPDEGFNPYYSLVLPEIEEGSFVLKDEEYIPLTAAEKKYITEEFISNVPSIRWWSGSERGKTITGVEISPIRKNPADGSLQKLAKFSYTYIQSRSSAISRSQSADFQPNSSVLANGDWFKISVSEDGVYKLDYNFLKSMGIDPTSINPKNIKIFGNGGGVLPQSNAANRPFDLTENAIQVVGEEDNVFNSDDYILFYGQAPVKWNYDIASKTFSRVKHPYETKSFYFLTIGDKGGLRISNVASVTNTNVTYNSFTDRAYYEKDLVNFLHSGREWYGELFDFQPNQNFDFPINGLDATDSTIIRVSVGFKASTPQNNNNRFNVNLNGLGIGSITSFNRIGDLLALFGVNGSGTYKVANSLINGSISVGLNYINSNSPLVSGYLNAIEVISPRTLIYTGGYMGFRTPASVDQTSCLYTISSSNSNGVIWDVTNTYSPLNILFNKTSNSYSFGALPEGKLHEYVIFDPNAISTPVFVKKVINQNLHGISSDQVPDMVIVTSEELRSAAQRLADLRVASDNLVTLVVTTEQIYNEFSSGSQDISAIRDFVRMLYKRRPSNEKLKYLNLFGSCSYDYKNITAGNISHVPVYETTNSLHGIESFSSDDFYGFLDDSEGTWAECYTCNEVLDIGIGRVPVRDLTEANAMVDKFSLYENSRNTMGDWRNKMVFMADVGDNNLHQDQADRLANRVTALNKNLNINKIYVDFFQWQTSPDGVRSAECLAAVQKSINNGALVTNYVGHGNENQVSSLNILNKSIIGELTNTNAPTFGIFATCDFGRYDDPKNYSGCETFILKTEGGAIGTMGSTRPVYSNSNELINDRFFDSLYVKRNGKNYHLGEVFRFTKNNSLYGLNNRNYALLTDPSLLLAFPQQEAVLTQYNSNPITSAKTDTIKALSKVTFDGEIRLPSGLRNTDFNGKIYVTVYDKENIVFTLGQKGGGNVATGYRLRNNIIYNGLALVTQGGFSFTFVVPKDISYNYDFSKISLYAAHDQTTLDAGGNNVGFVLGGTNPNAIQDITPPTIKLFLNDESFQSGGYTQANPVLIAKIFDENGINVSRSGIGHEITASLASEKNSPTVLNDFYRTEANSYKSGRVQYNYSDLPSGPNAITFKAWDTYNNSSETTLEFVVSNSASLAIKNVLNYPNPFSTHTSFHFDHNKPGDDLEMLVQIFTISGKLVKTLTGTAFASPSHVSQITWNGKDDFESEIGKGVYVYKISIRAVSDGSEVHQFEKLVILN